MLATLILAAGQSSRMRGRDKLLEPINDTPLLRVIAERACATASEVYVALPKDPSPRASVLDGLPVKRVSVMNADQGMGASISTGVAALRSEIDGVMILPADMPELTCDDLTVMIEAATQEPQKILRAFSRDRPGHPVVFPKSCFAALRALNGDHGGRAVIDSHKDILRRVDLPKAHAITDLDTPEAWAKWRASQA